MNHQEEKLLQDFPPVSTQEWMDKIIADLKGADFQKKMVWKTNEGFNVNPFYRAENIEGLRWIDNLPGEFPYVRSTRRNNEWYVRQDIKVCNFAEANKKALALLQRGITSLGFVLPKKDLSAENIATLLNGIYPNMVELNFRTCISRTVELARLVVDYILSQNLDVKECFGSIEFDPFRKILKKGADTPDWVDEAVEIVNIASKLPRYRVISVAGNLFSDAGAYIYQELGYSLAYGNAVLGKLIEKGVDPSTAAKKIKFELGVGSNYFMEIAKFRAARWLWAEIVNAYKPACHHECPNKEKDGTCRCAAKMNVYARTSRFNQTVYDPYVNLLRTQTEAMSATIAGVDSLMVLPFNEAYDVPDDFSERIARNQQLLLKEESHFDKIIDPSAGSYYIENLTLAIAQQAWKLFLETNEAGFYEALKAGSVQDAVNASAEARFKALASRREVLLGTNQYPNFTEKMGDKIARESQGCGCEDKGEALFKKLKDSRLASDFNALRLTTEGNETPKAFMLTIGNLAMRLARSQFSSNFFACAGYKIIDNLGFKTVAEGVKEAVEKNADLIVLCSSDDEYAEYAPEAYRLAEENHKLFVVAGAPACMDDLKAQGIENFIHVKSNVLDTLRIFNDKLGVK
ncbi:MAG: methylmalonyl-CoA mutase small subunit [Dysgonamonadaceae bacterium]|jgi:methylmalonyl-CoA mutase|nr:methylmalonyl-CoA mutase small subunit [Dysgonamonadaceae bacterium]